MTTPVLTVARLIEQLQAMPPDALVYAEGCDCTGAAGSICLSDGSVLIERHEDYINGGGPKG